MRKLSRMMAGAAALAAAATLVAGAVTTASAAPRDPAHPPTQFDIVGVGSNTTEYVMDQFSVNYNASVKTNVVAHPFFYSYDALPEGKSVPGTYKIKPKNGCAVTARPNGSGAGITALDSTQVIKFKGGSYQCIDFGRSSGGRKPTYPADKPGGIVFVAFAKDAISWAARSAAKGGTNAPASMNLAQLKAVFTCKDTNWKQVGGKAGAIKVYLPQAGSGTLSTWEKFMGITTLGACVSQAPEENEGTYAGFNTRNAVFIYSIGAFVAQKYHSPACGAKPAKAQNKFGCNTTGVLVPEKISGVTALSAAKVPTINPRFPVYYDRTVYNVVRYWVGTSDHISPKLEKIFGARSKKGYICSNASAQTVIRDYGFVTTPLCGSTS